MHPADAPNDPPTEGQIVPPEEQIIPSGGGPILGQEATDAVQESGGEEPEQGGGEPEQSDEGMADKVKEAAPESFTAAAGQAQSLAKEKPMPIALAAAFVAGIVVGRIASRK
jgi:hypothetical protein